MKLAVPDIISNSYFPAAAAVELGFFRREGLDVSLELIFPVDKAYQALREGAVDLVGGAAPFRPPAFARRPGPRIRRSPLLPTGRASSSSARRHKACTGFW